MTIASGVLRELSKKYIAFVDRGEDSEARSAAHERVMAQMRKDGISFADRIDAANIARDVVRLDCELDELEDELHELACEQNYKTIWHSSFNPRIIQSE